MNEQARLSAAIEIGNEIQAVRMGDRGPLTTSHLAAIIAKHGQGEDGRLLKLANLVWETRWVSEEAAYQNLVGIAAEILSGNFNSIDKP